MTKVKIIDTFFIRFGEVEDKCDTICYLGILVADEYHNYYWNLLVNNSKTLNDIKNRFIDGKDNRVYTLKGDLINVYSDGRCRINNVNIMEDITDKFIIKDDNEWTS